MWHEKTTEVQNSGIKNDQVSVSISVVCLRKYSETPVIWPTEKNGGQSLKTWIIIPKRVVLWYLGQYNWNLQFFYSWRNTKNDISHSPNKIYTLKPRQNSRYSACVFLNENGCNLIKISLEFMSKGRINNNQALFQIVPWHRSYYLSLLFYKRICMRHPSQPVNPNDLTLILNRVLVTL